MAPSPATIAIHRIHECAASTTVYMSGSLSREPREIVALGGRAIGLRLRGPWTGLRLAARFLRASELLVRALEIRLRALRGRRQLFRPRVRAGQFLRARGRGLL